MRTTAFFCSAWVFLPIQIGVTFVTFDQYIFVTSTFEGCAEQFSRFCGKDSFFPRYCSTHKGGMSNRYFFFCGGNIPGICATHSITYIPEKKENYLFLGLFRDVEPCVYSLRLTLLTPIPYVCVCLYMIG